METGVLTPLWTNDGLSPVQPKGIIFYSNSVNIQLFSLEKNMK